MGRIQVLTDDAEHAVFRAQARREGRSLSDWLREAGREQLRRAKAPQLATSEDLGDFFDAIDQRHAGEGPEEDWELQKRRIARSRVAGLPDDG